MLEHAHPTPVWSVFQISIATSQLAEPSQTFYMAFPFEWINTIGQRAEILGTALRWMCPIMEPTYLPLVVRGP